MHQVSLVSITLAHLPLRCLHCIRAEVTQAGWRQSYHGVKTALLHVDLFQ